MLYTIFYKPYDWGEYSIYPIEDFTVKHTSMHTKPLAEKPL